MNQTIARELLDTSHENGLAGTPPDGEREWEVARLFPPRGQWTEDDYLALDTNRVVELSDGCLEIAEMPTEEHQDLLLFLYERLNAFVKERALGKVLVSARPVRLWEGKFREPDVLFMRAEHAHRRNSRYWEGADWVAEVVSNDPKDRKRDLVKKRKDYAQARIPEYWIVDPVKARVTILVLDGDSYRVHAHHVRGDEATAVTIAGFSISVDALLDAG